MTGIDRNPSQCSPLSVLLKDLYKGILSNRTLFPEYTRELKRHSRVYIIPSERTYRPMTARLVS